MIDREIVTGIRHLYFAERWKVGTIAAQMGLHHQTVAAAIAEDIMVTTTSRPSQLDPYSEFMRQTLEQYPRLRSTRLFQMLRERGYTGSARQVRRKVSELRPRKQEAFLRRRTFPGEDYGETRVMLSRPATVENPQRPHE